MVLLVLLALQFLLLEGCGGFGGSLCVLVQPEQLLELGDLSGQGKGFLCVRTWCLCMGCL